MNASGIASSSNVVFAMYKRMYNLHKCRNMLNDEIFKGIIMLYIRNSYRNQFLRKIDLLSIF